MQSPSKQTKVLFLIKGTRCSAEALSLVYHSECVFTAAEILVHFRYYIPKLKAFPVQYIYEPWTAPLDVQQQAGCVIGHDYPAPMLDHYQMLHTNMLTLQRFLKAKQRCGKLENFCIHWVTSLSMLN